MMTGSKPGYLTVYMTLTLAVLLSLCLTMIEGARRSAMRMQAEIITDTALRSTLAEYNRELARQYNIFALDSSYGTTVSGMNMSSSHFREYVEKNYEFDKAYFWQRQRDFIGAGPEEAYISGASYLTDDKGRVFRKCAVGAILDDYGITSANEVISWAMSPEMVAADAMNVSLDMTESDGKVAGAAAAERSRRQEERARQEQEYEDACRDAEEKGEPAPAPPDYTELPEEYRSPVSSVAGVANTGIMGLILDDSDNLSRRMLDQSAIISGRMEVGKINTGNLEYESSASIADEDVLEKALFGEYLIRYMGYYGNTDDGDAMWYQIEYLIAGKSIDVENLNSVTLRILMIRAGMDMLYLESDGEKKGEAELLAAAICSACMIPQMTPVLTHAILLAWAFIEARYDTRTLLMGGRIDFIKTKANWHTDLDSALAGSFGGGGSDSKSGMSYKDYLRIFMYMTDLDGLTARAMDIIESDIRLSKGNSFFRMDACMEMVECSVSIRSSFGGRASIKRKLKY